MATERVLLLLEDNPALSRVVASVAAAEGWSVVGCVDTAQMEHALGAGPVPGAIIIDCMLAEGSGIEILGTIARLDRGIPILVVSGYGDHLLRIAADAARNAGLTRVATQAKPFAAHSLRAFLSTAAIAAPVAPLGGGAVV